MIRYLLIAFFIGAIMNAQDNRVVHGKYEFKAGAIEYLFGDNVKLRSEPKTTSKVFELLPIASPVKILEKTDSFLAFNGFDSPWYKVECQGKTGYVLGGLIALDHKKINDDIYLVTIKSEAENSFAKTRLVRANAPYVEIVNKLETTEFFVKAYDNRGLEEVVNMLHIDYMAEACGVEGGGIYLFNDGESLVKAFEYSQISDAGVYWFNEEYLFPSDEDGVVAKIVYKKELGSYQDEETNWFEIEKTQRELEWMGNKLVPDINVEETK
jgi:hypothetical protein